MSGRQIGVILIRLAAIFMVVRSVQALSWLPFSLSGLGEFQWEALIALIPMLAIPLGIAFVLWRSPSTVLGKLPPAEESRDTIDYDALMFVGVSLIGLYVLVTGVLELATAVSNHAMSTDYASRDGVREQIQHRYFIGIVQTVLGTALVLGRSGIARLMSRARRAGTPGGHNP